MPAADPARRAVVTGLGAVMPIGNDFETYWSNLRNAVTGHPPDHLLRPDRVRGADRRRGARLRPELAMDAKMARRMSRFIHLAMGAGKEAVEASGIDFAAMTPRQRDRVGGRREHGRRRDRGRSSTARTSTTRRARASCRRSRSRRCRARWRGCMLSMDYQPDGSRDDAGRRVRDVGHRLPRRAAADRDRRVRRRAGRRLRGPRVADGRGGARQHGRAVEAQRLARDRVPPVRRAPATASCSARARGVVVVESARARAASAAPRRSPRSSAAR